MSHIALTLNQKSLSWFKKITFLNHVREALYLKKNVYFMKIFKNWHNGLFHHVSNHLKSSSQKVKKYTQAEQQLPKGSLVHWVVFQNLLLIQSHHQYREIASQLNFEFIYGPLCDLFTSQQDLIIILKQLTVLEMCFWWRYLEEEKINWTHNFNTNINFFNQINATIIFPWDLMNSLTDSDLNVFNSFCFESIIKQDIYLQNMHRWWNKLYQAA